MCDVRWGNQGSCAQIDNFDPSAFREEEPTSAAPFSREHTDVQLEAKRDGERKSQSVQLIASMQEQMPD